MKDCPKVIPQRAECPFRKFVIPASLGGSTGEYAPKNGAYQNALVEYAADGTVFLYSSDGIFTQIPSGGNGTYNFNELLNRPKYAGEEMTSETDIPSVEDEASARQLADGELRTAIDDTQRDLADETSARQLADADLARGIDALGDAITYEITARGDADTALQTAISDEATARATADTSLGNSISAETTNRENADQGLQSQIDAITASSDVTDIVGTKAELNAYDTSTLGDNDIIKVLQDESRNNETTYYRWSTTTQTFNIIGEEGPYYTKSAADAQFVPQTRTVNGKALSANISLDAQDVGAVDISDVTQSTGTSTSEVMSQDATTTALGGKVDKEAGKGLSTEDYTTADQTKLQGLADIKSVGTNLSLNPVTGELDATDTTYAPFTGTDGTTAGTDGLVPAPATTDAGKFLKADGTWGTAGGGGVTVLNTSNMNWPTDSPTGWAVWLLGPGNYEVESPNNSTHIYVQSSASNRLQTSVCRAFSILSNGRTSKSFLLLYQVIQARGGYSYDTPTYRLVNPDGSGYSNSGGSLIGDGLLRSFVDGRFTNGAGLSKTSTGSGLSAVTTFNVNSIADITDTSSIDDATVYGLTGAQIKSILSRLN